jgi:MFS family permease
MNAPKAIFSTAWIFVTLNYLYCDLLTLMDPPVLKQFLAGSVGSLQITQGFLLGATVLMEIPMFMVILSRILPFRLNRWANIIAGGIMTVVQIGSLFMGSAVTVYYAFFSVIEISCTSLIVLYAWRWTPAELQQGV